MSIDVVCHETNVFQKPDNLLAKIDITFYWISIISKLQIHVCAC